MCFNVPPWSSFAGFHLTGPDPSHQNHHSVQLLKAHNFTRLCMLIWLFIKQAIIYPLNRQVQKPGSTSVTWIRFVIENIHLWKGEKKSIVKSRLADNQLKQFDILTTEDKMVTTTSQYLRFHKITVLDEPMRCCYLLAQRWSSKPTYLNKKTLFNQFS